MTEYKASDVLSVSNKEELDLLRKENFELLSLLEEYGINYKEARIVSDVEWICRKEIHRLKQKSDVQGLDDNEVDNLEKLTKVLDRETNRVSNKGTKTPKGKKLSGGELIELLKDAPSK